MISSQMILPRQNAPERIEIKRQPGMILLMKENVITPELWTMPLHSIKFSHHFSVTKSIFNETLNVKLSVMDAIMKSRV